MQSFHVYDLRKKFHPAYFSWFQTHIKSPPQNLAPGSTIKRKERKKENKSLRRLSTKVENQCLQAVPFLLKTEQSSLTLWTLRSASIFSILFSVHFLWNRQGESIQQSMFLRLVIIYFILMISMNDSTVKLWNEKLHNGHF